MEEGRGRRLLLHCGHKKVGHPAQARDFNTEREREREEREREERRERRGEERREIQM